MPTSATTTRMQKAARRIRDTAMSEEHRERLDARRAQRIVSLLEECLRLTGMDGATHPAGDVADLVRAEIQRRGISVYQAATEMGIVRQRLHQLLRGDVTPSREVLLGLASWVKGSQHGHSE